MSDTIDARIARMDAFQAKCTSAAEAVTAVLLDPELTGYTPHRDSLLEALGVLDIETTCGDCLELECHGADEDACGCARHEASVEARDRTRRLRAAGTVPTEGGAS